MKAFLIGFLLGIAALPAAAVLYILFGYAPVATAAPPFPFERKLASMALNARIKKEAPVQAGVPATPENLMAGARVYRDLCAGCHGMRTGPKTAAAAGMYPPPPRLLQGKGVTDDPPGETYWKVTNGIRLTGMPAFANSTADVERWQVSQLLANADHLPAGVAAYLQAPPPAH